MEIGFQITRTNAIYVLKLLHEYASRIICYVIETMCSSFLFILMFTLKLYGLGISKDIEIHSEGTASVINAIFSVTFLLVDD